MRILVLGDPHGKKIKKTLLKNIDLILITGDIGKADLARKMAFENVKRRKKGLDEKIFSNSLRKKSFMQIYKSTINLLRYYSKFAQVYLIFGNVEMPNKEIRKFAKEIDSNLPFLYNDLNKMKNVRIINNRIANFKGLRIGGLKYFLDTSWVKEFKPGDCKKAMRDAKKETKKARKILNNFKKVDILLCHQPPYGILDKVTSNFAPKHWRNKHAGSKAILNYIKKYHPKFVFCGHIHEAEGKKKLGNTLVQNLGCCGKYSILAL